VKTLPEPDVLDCDFDDQFAPALAAMTLRWPGDAAVDEDVWFLPQGVHLTGRAPVRFGLRVRRCGLDTYALSLLWDTTRLSWPNVTRDDVVNGSLPSILAALRTDLAYLLDQPIASSPNELLNAA
jgi:hypothetical protein